MDAAPVRAWVAGCSSGEEGYSLAMVAQEGMDKLKKRFPVQIFGTDLTTPKPLNPRRTGLSTPDGIARDVRPLQMLARFFVKEDGGYRIKKGDSRAGRIHLRAAKCFE